jgi:hypothetical protein
VRRRHVRLADVKGLLVGLLRVVDRLCRRGRKEEGQPSVRRRNSLCTNASASP